MSLLRTVAIAASLTMALACHQATPDPNFWGCKDLPLLGPPSHLVVRLSDTLDPQLKTSGSGRLVVLASWSSDSLARHSKPTFALLRISNTNKDIAEATDSSGGFKPVELPVPPNSYRLAVRLIAVQSLDTTVTVRHGFTDTVRVYLQSGGMRICA
jgi:hypothetical protein